RDLDVQDAYGVQFLTYWFNSPEGHSFCLVESPSKEAAIEVHKASHGLVPYKMIEVNRPTVSQFMGDWERHVPNEARTEGPDSPIDSGLRAILFTDLEGSTDVSSRLGDDQALELIKYHDRIVRAALNDEGGREVKHTGDGIMSSFTFVSRAVSCATRIQREFAGGEAPVDGARVRIGISAGEPVDQSDDMFGASVSLASRICAHAEPGQILVSSAVKELSIGKGIEFDDCGPIALKGFDDALRLYEVVYH
ncbi:MAG: nickel-binding protein, partial [Actinomycetota bacterium]